MFGFLKRVGSGSTLPTVKFDASRVTAPIRDDLWNCIEEFEDLPVGAEEEIFEAAVVMAQRGGDLHHLAKTLRELGVVQSRASYISHYLGARSKSLMDVQRMRDLGIIEGIWRYSGTPCFAVYPNTIDDSAGDAAHKSASGTMFRLDKGLMLNGKWTFPRREPGCKCVISSVI